MSLPRNYTGPEPFLYMDVLAIRARLFDWHLTLTLRSRGCEMGVSCVIWVRVHRGDKALPSFGISSCSRLEEDPALAGPHTCVSQLEIQADPAFESAANCLWVHASLVSQSDLGTSQVAVSEMAAMSLEVW